MGLRLKVAPACEPISLNEAKLHLRVDDTASDTLISRLIRTARVSAELFVNQQLVTATWEYTLNAFANVIPLPRPPLQSVSSITYIDNNGDTQTVSTDVYEVDVSSLIGRVYLAYGQSWPTTRNEINAVTITFKSGHVTKFTADTSADVITWSNRTPADDETYALTNSGGISGALPAGLALATTYYTINSTGQTCQLATSSGGSAVDITDTGTGTHFLGEVPDNIREAMLLYIAHWHENREAVITGTIASELPAAAKSLLWLGRIAEAR